jgi:hypothetical protein
MKQYCCRRWASSSASTARVTTFTDVAGRPLVLNYVSRICLYHAVFISLPQLLFVHSSTSHRHSNCLRLNFGSRCLTSIRKPKKIRRSTRDCRPFVKHWGATLRYMTSVSRLLLLATAIQSSRMYTEPPNATRVRGTLLDPTPARPVNRPKEQIAFRPKCRPYLS